MPTAKLGSNCFMLVLALRLGWGWAHRWVRDAGLRLYRESAISLLQKQFVQPLPSLHHEEEASSWFSPQRSSLCTQTRFQIPGHETTLYLDHLRVGNLHWSSFSSIYFASITLRSESDSLATWAATLLSCPLALPHQKNYPTSENSISLLAN